MKRTVLFIGKPGCGKGTQAKILSDLTGWTVVSSGDLFRGIEKENSVLGYKVKQDLDQGLLMPSWFAIYLFQRTVFGHDGELIFDGFGRKTEEAKMVLEVLNWLERPLKVIHLQVPDEEIIERLIKRRAISGRLDDFSIEKRLEEYHQYTEPAIEIFRDVGIVSEVDGGKTNNIHQISKRIEELVNV